MGEEGGRERERDRDDRLLAAGLLRCQKECCIIRLALSVACIVLCGASDPLRGEFVP